MQTLLLLIIHVSSGVTAKVACGIAWDLWNNPVGDSPMDILAQNFGMGVLAGAVVVGTLGCIYSLCDLMVIWFT